eukprot:SM000145S00793  [mRNA]  locus=s145:177030:180900:+ [translate_table: standard]
MLAASSQHHCRRCGAAVCGGCSTGRVPVHGPVGGDLVKACDRCLADHRAALREARNAKRGARPGVRGHGPSVVDGAKDAEDSPPPGHVRSASDPLLLPADEDSRSPAELRAAAAQERARSSELRRNGLAAAASRAFQLSKALERQAADAEAQHAAAGVNLGRATAAAAAPALPPDSILSSKSADFAQLVPGSVAGGSATPPTGGDSPRLGAGGRRKAGQPSPPGRSTQAPPPRRRSLGSGVTADDEKDPEILRMLAELGWSDADVSRSAPPRSDASAPSTGHGSSSRGGDHLRSKAMAAKKAALAFKREGRAADALAEMKRAKQLEAEADEADILGAGDDEEGNDDGGDNVDDLEKLLGLDQPGKASGADDSYFANLQGLPQLDLRNLAAIGIGDTEDDDVGSKGNSVDLDENVDEQDLDDPQMVAALREMGWEDDAPLVKMATGQGGPMAATASAPEAPVLTESMMEEELGACRQRAIALKREGRATEALAEMRRAKALEMALAEGHQKQQQQQQQQPAPVAKPTTSGSHRDTGGSDMSVDDNNDDNDIDVTDDDLNDPDMAAALADLGWSKDADENKGAGRGVQESVLPPPPSLRVPLAVQQLAEAAEEEGEDDNVEVTDSDLADPDIAAVLKGLGWKDEEVIVPPAPAKVLPAAPNLQPAMATQGMLGTGNGSGTVSLQEQVEVHRSRALALKREGRSAEALEEMRKSKVAAAQLEDLLTDVQAAVDAGLGTVPATAKNGFVQQPLPSSTSTTQLPAERVPPPLASVSVPASAPVSAPTSAQSSRLDGSTTERRQGTRSSTGRPGEPGQRLETVAMTAVGPVLHDPSISGTQDFESASQPEQLLITTSGRESTQATTASSGSAKASAVALQPAMSAAPSGRAPTERSSEGARIKNMAAAEEAEHREQALEEDIAVVLNQLGVIGPSSMPAMLSGRHLTEAPGSRIMRPASQQPEPSAQSKLPVRQGAYAPSRMTTGGSEASASLASSMMAAADQPSKSGVSSAAITGPLDMQPPAAASDASEGPSGVVQQIAALKRRALALRKEGKSAEALDCLKQSRALASRQAGQGGLGNRAECDPIDSGTSQIATQVASEPVIEEAEHASVEDILDPQLMTTLQGVGLTIGPSKELQQPPLQVSASEEEKRKLVNEIRAGKLKALSLKREGKKQEALESLRAVKNLEQRLAALS